MMMDILNTGISNIIDIKATNKTRQVQTAWAGPVWRWLRTTASRQVSGAMDANYRSWTVATMTANFSGCTSEWYAVNYRGCNSKSNDGCDHQLLDRCGMAANYRGWTGRSIDAVGLASSKCVIYCEQPWLDQCGVGCKPQQMDRLVRPSCEIQPLHRQGKGCEYPQLER